MDLIERAMPGALTWLGMVKTAAAGERRRVSQMLYFQL